ncbi:MAG: phosphoglucosamine mutase [Candidatus Lokiarchaeota archaeon]|nr:phosphoglucosamine mutase [Candidatus Lokiarchaeota archaeon]
MFGTSGIRKVFSPYGNDIKQFTPSTALKIGLAIGSYIKGKTVVIGRDIRTTAIPIELALNSGLISAGCKVLTLGMVTTPTLAMSMKFLGGDCGVMITASHNTPEYIGIKLWNPSGLGFTPEQELDVENIYKKKAFRKIKWDEVGTFTHINDINTLHVDEILKQIKCNPKNGIRQVIIDPGNGSSCEIAPLLLKRLRCKYVTLNSQPDGHFPGRLSEPSIENLQIVSNIIKNSPNIDLGMALDGDADRVIFIDANGEIIESIRMLTFLAKKELERHPTKKGTASHVMTPINSSNVIERTLEPLGCKVVRTPVGDIRVAIEIQKQGGFIGGENSGTYIWPTFHMGPDSLVTIAKLIEILSYEKKSFTELISEIPNFPFVKKEYPLTYDKSITSEEYKEMGTMIEPWLHDQGFTEIRYNHIDGLRMDFEKGWILIRRSGTSPILRVEGESTIDIKTTHKNIDAVAKILMDTYDFIQ